MYAISTTTTITTTIAKKREMDGEIEMMHGK